jgi:hypothetical protein
MQKKLSFEWVHDFFHFCKKILWTKRLDSTALLELSLKVNMVIIALVLPTTFFFQKLVLIFVTKKYKTNQECFAWKITQLYYK